MTVDSRIPLGVVVRDVITGFTGVVIGRTEYLNGCVRVGVQPRKLDKDGKVKEIEWIDERQVEVLAATFRGQPIEPTGGPQPRPSDLPRPH